MIKQVDVAISSKDMCIVVKGKTDVHIAGYLRNICQYSPYNMVKHLIPYGNKFIYYMY